VANQQFKTAIEHYLKQEEEAMESYGEDLHEASPYKTLE
jgi:predicted N-acyltransferase